MGTFAHKYHLHQVGFILNSYILNALYYSDHKELRYQMKINLKDLKPNAAYVSFKNNIKNYQYQPQKKCLTMQDLRLVVLHKG